MNLDCPVCLLIFWIHEAKHFGFLFFWHDLPCQTPLLLMSEEVNGWPQPTTSTDKIVLLVLEPLFQPIAGTLQWIAVVQI